MFKTYQAKIEWQSEYKIIFICHDSKEENSSDEYVNYLKKLEVTVEYTAFCTSEQDDKIEYLNYSLMFII